MSRLIGRAVRGTLFPALAPSTDIRVEVRRGTSSVIKDVIGSRELVVTKYVKMTVALVAASQLYQYRQMERELNEFLAALEHDKSSSDTKLELAALKKRVAAKRKGFESFMSKL